MPSFWKLVEIANESPNVGKAQASTSSAVAASRFGKYTNLYQDTPDCAESQAPEVHITRERGEPPKTRLILNGLCFHSAGRMMEIGQSHTNGELPIDTVERKSWRSGFRARPSTGAGKEETPYVSSAA
jgi:hypothetical protein